METICIGNKLSKARISVGKGLETKINLIVGVNNDTQINLEKTKIQAGARLGVHTIIDLSTIRLDYPLWMYGRDNFPDIAFGKVPPILVAQENKGDVDPEKLLREIEWSVISGIDYMTLNLIPRRLADIRSIKMRNIPTTSRQGGVLLNHMIRNNTDNPYEPILDQMLDLFKQYNVTIHIGSTFRPKSVTEAYDLVHKWELKEQMEMFRIFDEAGVQAIVEPMSHQSLGQIGPGIEQLRKEYGSYVPFQMLGPITTEVNYGRDQYAAASGSAIAAMYNVGKITTIPPGEHERFPNLQDSIEGIKATLTGVHAGDMCRLPYLADKDREIARQRDKRKSCNSHSNTPGCNKCLHLCPLLLEIK